VLELGSLDIDAIEEMTTSYTEMDLDPYQLFSNSIRSPLTREKYQRRIDFFFNFIILPVGASIGNGMLFVPTDKVNLYPNEGEGEEIGGSIVAFTPIKN